MTRADSLRSEITRLQHTGSGLTKKLAGFRGDAQRATAEATKKRGEARRATSESSRRMADSAADRAETKHVDATRRAGDIEGDIARNNRAIAGKQASLESTLKSEQRDKDREDERRRRAEVTHVREVARVLTPATVRYVVVPTPKAEELRVLYLTASPDGEERIRVDREVREVQHALRGSKYRDLVQVEYRPAATTSDIVDGLNDIRPHVLHMSGHGDADSLFLEDDDGRGGRSLSFAMIARVLGDTDTPPTLVVLNACKSLDGADELLQGVPIVVGMTDSVTDSAAIIFAERFYAAIASAQSVGSAIAQARTALQGASLDGADLLQDRHRDDVDPFELVLVRP